MIQDFYQQTFDKINVNDIQGNEYEQCTFVNSDFSGANLTGIKLVDCQISECGFSLATLSGATLNNVSFKNCKMLGLRFDQCNPFTLSFSFDHCVLNDSSFFKCKIKKTLFRNSQLHHVDFAQCDLTESGFDECDLQNAIFENTILLKADLRTSFNYSINPEVNQIKKAKFSSSGLKGLLEKYDIIVAP